MKKRFSISDMSVRKKITAFSVIMIIFMLVISLVGIWCALSINSKHKDRYNNYAMGNYYLSEAYGSFTDVEVCLLNMMYVDAENTAKVEESAADITKYEGNLQKYLGEFSNRLDVFEDAIDTQFASIAADMRQFESEYKNIIALIREGNAEGARQEFETNGEAISKKVEEELVALLSDVEKASEKESDSVENLVRLIMIALIAATAVSILFTLFCCFALVKSITVPIRKLSEAAKKLAIGDVDVDCTKVYNDDLGELMDDFAEMTESIREQVKVADAIAKGDLTVDVKARSDKDVLSKALHKLVADQNVTLNNIREAGSQITVGSEQVANASQALAQGSTEQASALEQVTASMDEVTQRIKNNATEAGEANVLVNNIKDMAADGNAQMKSMIEAMDSINESSETISKIISTIDSIAFQTNILALNAAVEAARAGVHGKGFAVVAEEVRSLAAKSASAASETAEMIEDSIRKIANGTKIAESTAKSLDEIVKSIDEIVGLISNISVSSNDQSTAISQIDQAISQVSTVVQTNAATSEQCAAASEELSNQAVTLKNLIGQYRLLTGMQGGGFDGSSSYGSAESIISLDGDLGKY